MSQENVERLIERTADALNRADVDAFTACCHPEVDWEENSSAYIGVRQHNRGRAGASEWFQEAILDVWDSWRFTLLETAWEASTRRDNEAVFRLYDPEVEIHD